MKIYSKRTLRKVTTPSSDFTFKELSKVHCTNKLQLTSLCKVINYLGDIGG